MTTVNMLEAKSTLSRLVDAIEQGRVSEIVIARNGRPAARLVPLSKPAELGQRLGAAKGQFKVPESIDSSNEEVARLLAGSLPP